ncbi:MAG: SHOCT domain-containing protein [Actinomycetia bacterium]|nr:SHOCT domain-containing protein [Actinomycetes bacterium]
MSAQTISAARSGSSPSLTAGGGGSGDNPLASQLTLLTRLGEPRDAGALTDQEFAAKKPDILAFGAR